MKTVDLFAGAGGASYGLEAAGCELVEAVEFETHAAIAHRRNFPGVPVANIDIRTWTPSAADLWWSSPPCQAWSTAGKRLGAKDERNGWPWLWDAYDRAEHKPTWLIAENVSGILLHKEKGGPDNCPMCYWEEVVLVEAKKRFPHVQVWKLNAADYGVPQNRKRVILVCGPVKVKRPEPTHGPGRKFPHRTLAEVFQLDPEEYPALDRPGNTVVASESRGRLSKMRWPAPVAEAILQAFDRKYITIEECAGVQGFPEDAEFVGTRKARYRQVGNAVPPKMAQVVVEAILSAT